MHQTAFCEPSGMTGARAFALTADENGRFQQAATAYETHLASSPGDLEAILNLAILYWQATEAGACVGGGPSTEFVSGARNRVSELLEDASQRFAARAEVRFWRRYISSIRLGEPLGVAECRELLRERPDYLEPAFVVFSNSSGQEAEPEAMRLLARCADEPTARSRHVISVINGVLRWQRWRWA
jgi:hypothetical protein